MSWLQVVSAIMATTVTAATADQPVRIDPASAEQIALQRESYERVTVPVTIGGMGPYRFMVDTGAQATVVSSTLADRLGLTDRTPAVLVGLLSKQPVETAEISNFALGSHQFDIRTAPIVPAANLGGADGILGLDSLQNQRVLIDFVKNRILVADAKALGGNIGYEIVVKARRRLGQLIITGAQLNGVDTDVIIDTGSEGSVGNGALLERLRRARALGENTMTDVNGTSLTATVREGERLSISGMTLNNIPIMFADTPAFHALGLDHKPALVLGIEQLKVFRRVAIDFNKRQILFDLPRSTRSEDIDSFASQIGGKLS